MQRKLNDVYICDSIRTPIGSYGGSLASVRADDLAALPLTYLKDKYANQVDWDALDHVILGCANQSGEDNRNIARMSTLLSGLPVHIAAYTVNRLCASGMEAVSQAARAVRLGEMSLVIAGGAEQMTRAPFVIGKANNGYDRTQTMYDSTMGWRFVNKKMKAEFGVETMPQTADNLARDFNLSREDQDAFAYRSQQNVAKSRQRLAMEIMDVTIQPHRKAEPFIFNEDEHPRSSTLEKMAALKSFISEDSTITAANSSGINDGAAALLIADEAAVKKYNLTPMAKIVHATATALEPRIMGYGPVSAVKKLLAEAEVSLENIEHLELNEAFASQVLSVLQGLNLPFNDERVNPYGGAIALGHPLGMSGARIVGSSAYELATTNKRYALCAMCVGVGQGSAMLLERV